MTKRIYVAQYEFVWSLTLPEWIEIAEAGARGEGYELPGHRELARPPSWIHRARNRSGAEVLEFWSSRSDVELVQPLDWTAADFQQWLDNHQEKTK